MRLSKTFGIIAAALTIAVGALLAAPVLHGQQATWVASGAPQGPGHAQQRQRTFTVIAGDDQPNQTMQRRNIEVIATTGGARLGVSITDIQQADLAKLKLASHNGVIVEDVERDSAAAKAGLKAGDVVVQFDGEGIRSAQQFTRLVRETPVGRAVKVGVMRDGKRVDVEATLAEGEAHVTVGGGDMRPQIEKLQQELQNLQQFRMRRNPPNGPAQPPEPMDPNAQGNRFFFRNGPGGQNGFQMFEVPEGRGRLGVTVQELTPELANFFGVKDGVLVATVRPDSPAAKAGIKAGDVITALGDKAVKSPDELVAALGEKTGEIAVTVVRDKKTLTLKPTVDAGPSKPRIPMKGVGA